jgi:hypothetical protein
MLAAVGCTNDPYPAADDDKKVVYHAFAEPPKTLDPISSPATSTIHCSNTPI